MRSRHLSMNRKLKNFPRKTLPPQREVSVNLFHFTPYFTSRYSLGEAQPTPESKAKKRLVRS